VGEDRDGLIEVQETAVIKTSRENDAVAVVGYRAKGNTHRAHFLNISKDLPVMIADFVGLVRPRTIGP
jgi:hypothetical protein